MGCQSLRWVWSLACSIGAWAGGTSRGCRCIGGDFGRCIWWWCSSSRALQRPLAAQEDIVLVLPEIWVGKLTVDTVARVVQVLTGKKVDVGQALALLHFNNLEKKIISWFKWIPCSTNEQELILQKELTVSTWLRHVQYTWCIHSPTEVIEIIFKMIPHR